MNDNDLKRIKRRLEKSLDWLLWRTTVEVRQGLDSELSSPITADVNEWASDTDERSCNSRIGGRYIRLRIKIEEALQRIEERSFGICDKCGEPIGDKRLWVRPIATLCIACKEVQEREERLNGKPLREVEISIIEIEEED